MKYLTTCALCALATAPALAQEAFDLDTITVIAQPHPAGNRAHRGLCRGDRRARCRNVGHGTHRPSQPASRRELNQPRPAGHQYLHSAQLRGLPARYVGVRINGIDVTDPSGPQTQFNFGGLTGAGLGRIEVLKGSQSALYGSEAIGGVVDITTWRPERDGLSGEVRAEAGRYETYTGALNLGYRGARGRTGLRSAITGSTPTAFPPAPEMARKTGSSRTCSPYGANSTPPRT
ncbi:MAG: TonB-dependent receptor plug domain-containing protein [Roseovarius sp.]|nr:TonB-dependent receptor plug domain-containing protein [Roseovarius sp.]